MAERSAFSENCQRWRRFACDAAEKILRSRDDAEDVAQRVLVRAWKSRAWRRVENAKLYFQVAARREAMNVLRNRERRRNRESDAEPTRFMAQPSLLADQQLSAKESRRFWAGAISRLPARCQFVCSLVFLEGLTQTEVASILDISEGAVEKQVARGRRNLKKCL